MALPCKPAVAKPQPQAASKKSAWSLSPDEDEELLDDSELLTEEDLQRPAVPCTSLYSSQFQLCNSCNFARLYHLVAAHAMQAFILPCPHM